MRVEFHAPYAAWVIRTIDGRQAFRDGFPLVYETRADAEAALAQL